MKQHIHKFRRVDIGREKSYYVMQCSLPGCNHYTPMNSKLSCPSLIGKVALCNECGDAFTLTRLALRLAKPTCGCVKSDEAKKTEAAGNFFNNLLKPKELE